MNYGFQNEIDFVVFFNNKYLNDFDKKSYIFLINLFDGKIENDEPIIAWKNKLNQKADIFLKYKNYVKGISLKYGSNNSMHTESIESFSKYLESLKIPYKVIQYYISYHFGYTTLENGKKDYSKILCSEEYKKIYQEEIDIFNKYINKTRIIIDMVDRFIVKGCNSKYDIDALISGSIYDYVWILKYDLYDLIINKMKNDITSPHASLLVIGPKTRNINGNCKHKNEKYRVCVKWHHIKEDISNFYESLNMHDC